MQKRIFFSIAVVLLIGVIISGVFSAGMVEKNFVNNVEESLITDAGLIRVLIGDQLFITGSNLDDYLGKIKSITNARITIVDAGGNVLIDTERDSTSMDNHAQRPEIAEAYKGKTGKAIRYSNTLKVDLLYVAQPVLKSGKVIGVIRLSEPLYQINALIKRLYFNIFIAVLLGAIVSILLGLKMSINITKPIKDITYTASRIAAGQFEKRINVSGRDEIGTLANAINDMASKLNDTIASLKDKNTRLEAIMSSVINGIVAIDRAERVLFINPIAIEQLDIKDPEVIGKHLLKVVRSNSIDNYLKTILKEKRCFDTEISLDYPTERIYKLYANPIKQFEESDIAGILITIQDITELRKLERMRTEFVANVSHELKTPLTSIKGFVETLKGGAIEDREDAIRFLDIIESETDRLYRLISDILSLSELEQKMVKSATEIEVEKTVKEVLSMIKNEADRKCIELTSEVQEGIDNLWGDPDKFKQMLLNLVDNAVKYTPEKGKVKVEAYKQTDFNGEERLTINVIDNGIGIPREHIPRLFERFYRVDKARSRKVGGTGLGLAIVKHIVILFGGEIEVRSEEGKGTVFSVTLPLKA
ncbi:MAG: two-component system histidine kinase PnpS [Caulobacteraceae bacterium]